MSEPLIETVDLQALPGGPRGPAAEDTPAHFTLRILRYRPDQDTEPHWETYTVPFNPDLSVLQALQYVKDEIDGSLAYRWSCRQAICGSCGMMINGRPQLSCQTFVRDVLDAQNSLSVEALSHFDIEKDLIVNVAPFVRNLEAVKPYLIPAEARTLEQGEYLQTPQELAEFNSFSGCINCMLCYAACPQFGLDDTFVGPGALALLHRYNADSRDGGQAQRLEVLGAVEGVWSCTAVGYCSVVCPKGVDPAHAVNQNKVKAAQDYFLRFLSPKGHQGAA